MRTLTPDCFVATTSLAMSEVYRFVLMRYSTYPAAAPHSSPPAPSTPPRREHVIQFRRLHLLLERRVIEEPVQQRRHPPGEALHLPDPAQARCGIRIELPTLAAPIERHDGARQHRHVGGREVQPLRPGRRHDMRGVPRQEQPAALHRLDDEAAHRRDAALQDRAFRQRESIARRAHLQLRPDPIVRPRRDVLVRRALQIQPAQRRRAHRQQRESALMADIDILLGRRRRLGQDAEPAERIVALEHAQHACRGSMGGTRHGTRRSRR